jgi:hypothetical protein
MFRYIIFSVSFLFINCFVHVDGNLIETDISQKKFNNQEFLITYEVRNLQDNEVSIDTKKSTFKDYFDYSLKTIESLNNPITIYDGLDSLTSSSLKNNLIKVNYVRNVDISDVQLKSLLNVFSIGLIPTWYTSIDNIKIEIVDKKNKVLKKKEYKFSSTQYNQIFLLFAMPFVDHIFKPDFFKISIQNFLNESINENIL